MKKSITKRLLLTTLLTSSVVWGGAPAFAEESLNEYSIDEIVVTATRTEKRDVDVPATTEIITSKRLEETGATTLESAIKYTTGVVYKSEPIGSGYYDLDSLSIADVEKVEIVRGGGAVLYGSDTSGGVINISPKRNALIQFLQL